MFVKSFVVGAAGSLPLSKMELGQGRMQQIAQRLSAWAFHASLIPATTGLLTSFIIFP